MDRAEHRQKTIDRHKHVIAGIVCDAVMKRDGTELAMFLRIAMSKIDREIGGLFDELVPKEEEKPKAEPEPKPVAGTIPMRRTS